MKEVRIECVLESFQLATKLDSNRHDTAQQCTTRICSTGKPWTGTALQFLGDESGVILRCIIVLGWDCLWWDFSRWSFPDIPFNAYIYKEAFNTDPWRMHLYIVWIKVVWSVRPEQRHLVLPVQSTSKKIVYNRWVYKRTPNLHSHSLCCFN